MIESLPEEPLTDCLFTKCEVVMEGTALLQLPEGMLLDQIQITEHGLMIEVRATSPTASCPRCSEVSSSIHCHYYRTLRDVPCAGRQVQLRLTVRKFYCRNPFPGMPHQRDIRVERRLMLSCSAFYYRIHSAVYGQRAVVLTMRALGAHIIAAFCCQRYHCLTL